MRKTIFLVVAALSLFAAMSAAEAKEKWTRIGGDEYQSTFLDEGAISLEGPMKFKAKIKIVPTKKGRQFEEFRIREMTNDIHVDILAETFHMSHMLITDMKGRTRGYLEADNPSAIKPGSVAMDISRKMLSWLEKYFRKHPEKETPFYEACALRIEEEFPEKFQKLTEMLSKDEE